MKPPLLCRVLGHRFDKHNFCRRCHRHKALIELTQRLLERLRAL